MASISKRESGAWQNTSYDIRATATDTITTLPTTIYGDGTNATISIKGNTVQSGTQTPDSPIMPEGCGELEAGQYKIPISSGDTTTPVYLGEVESTRRIKKLVLTGEENLKKDTDLGAGARYFYRVPEIAYKGLSSLYVLCTHYTVDESFALNTCRLYLGTRTNIYITVDKNDYPTIEDYQAYLAQQYTAGTPVTFWYVLDNPETAVVNDPLMKIEDYADVVNNISIPTTDGANTLSVDTTVQPSEVSVNYHGWHMGTVHERTAGQWD